MEGFSFTCPKIVEILPDFFAWRLRFSLFARYSVRISPMLEAMDSFHKKIALRADPDQWGTV